VLIALLRRQTYRTPANCWTQLAGKSCYARIYRCSFRRNRNCLRALVHKNWGVALATALEPERNRQ
jgi:hypothetical protein